MLHTVVTAGNAVYRTHSEPKISDMKGTNGFPVQVATFIDAETGDEITVGPVKAICTPLRQ